MLLVGTVIFLFFVYRIYSFALCKSANADELGSTDAVTALKKEITSLDVRIFLKDAEIKRLKQEVEDLKRKSNAWNNVVSLGKISARC